MKSRSREACARAEPDCKPTSTRAVRTIDTRGDIRAFLSNLGCPQYQSECVVFTIATVARNVAIALHLVTVEAKQDLFPGGIGIGDPLLCRHYRDATSLTCHLYCAAQLAFGRQLHHR